jgi:hypothetical protein
LPANLSIGRNVVIKPRVDADTFAGSSEVASGSTIG